MKTAIWIMGIVILILVISLVSTNLPSVNIYKLRRKLDRKCAKKRNEGKSACAGIGEAPPITVFNV